MIDYRKLSTEQLLGLVAELDRKSRRQQLALANQYHTPDKDYYKGRLNETIAELRAIHTELHQRGWRPA